MFEDARTRIGIASGLCVFSSATAAAFMTAAMDRQVFELLLVLAALSSLSFGFLCHEVANYYLKPWSPKLGILMAGIVALVWFPPVRQQYAFQYLGSGKTFSPPLVVQDFEFGPLAADQAPEINLHLCNRSDETIEISHVHSALLKEHSVQRDTYARDDLMEDQFRRIIGVFHEIRRRGTETTSQIPPGCGHNLSLRIASNPVTAADIENLSQGTKSLLITGVVAYKANHQEHVLTYCRFATTPSTPAILCSKHNDADLLVDELK